MDTMDTMKLRLGYKPPENWRIEPSEKDPEILCISGPYLDQLICREVRNRSTQELTYSSWSDHHHSHSTVYRSRVDFKDILSLIEDLKEDYTFMLQEGLRFRKEKNGIVIPQGRNAYFVNDKGTGFLRELKNRVITIRDIRETCKKLDISEQTGLNFFKTLIIFQVLEWIPKGKRC
jgi:hypothetical protein